MGSSETSVHHPDLVSDVMEAIESAEEQENVEIEVGEQQIDEQITEYKDNRVSDTNAVKHVVKAVLDEAGINNPRRFLVSGGRRASGSVPSVTIDEIGDHLYWFNLDVEGVTVIETYEPESEKKTQTGYVADSAGKIRYTLWADADIDPLESGQDYNLSTVSVNEYQGELEINIGGDSSIEPTEDGPQIAPDSFVDEFEGCIVGFYTPTGLIGRCQASDCGRSLDYGTEECPDCGSNVEDELLVKAVLDTGSDTVTAYFYREHVEDLFGRELAECVELAEQNGLQTVRDRIEANLHGAFLSVRGSKRRRNFYVDEFDYQPAPTPDDLEALADELASVV